MTHVWCRTITLRKDKFDEREDDFYEALYTQSQAQFATYVQTGTVVNNYAHIFDLLIRLRQVAFLSCLFCFCLLRSLAICLPSLRPCRASAPALLGRLLDTQLDFSFHAVMCHNEQMLKVMPDRFDRCLTVS